MEATISSPAFIRRAAITPPRLRFPDDMPRKFHGTDYFQTSEPDLLFRDVSLFTQTILAADEVPRHHSSSHRSRLCGTREWRI